MIDRLEGTVHDNEIETLFCKTPGLNNPETHVLTDNGFYTILVLIFSDLNETHIYKMPYRRGPNHEIEMLLCFNYLYLFKPFEDNEVY